MPEMTLGHKGVDCETYREADDDKLLQMVLELNNGRYPPVDCETCGEDDDNNSKKIFF